MSSTQNSTPSLSLVDDLRDLHEVYVDAVNRALEEGRDELVDRLAAEYTDEAAALMGRRPAAA